MEFELLKGDFNYLRAEKNMDLDDLVKYFQREEMEGFMDTDTFHTIKNESMYSVLESVYVLPSEREEGKATSMIYEYLKKVKVDVYFLLADTSIDTENFSIEQFYRKFGFETVYQDDVFPIMMKKTKSRY